MCGIAGIAAVSERTIPRLREKLTAMADAMVHRGPDDLGVYVSPDGRMGLTTRRLSIRDLSPAGHMPMSTAGGEAWITYNGEIYNADELRVELETQGRRFRSHSDTEVILEGYCVWGEAVVEKLRGMFAFGIVDRRGRSGESRLLLARDGLGIKPLYYARTADGLVFGSELKTIRASGLVGASLNPSAISAYLLTGSVPSPLSIFQDVVSLEPGSTLVWDGRDVRVERRLTLEARIEARLKEPVENAWLSRVSHKVQPGTTSDTARLKSGTTSTFSRGTNDYADAVAQVRDALADAVRSHLVSDVPLGAFLSGGLDSSIVVALMRQATSGPIRTCSLAFEEQEYSEGSYAREIAAAVGSEHFERVITAGEVASRLDEVFRAMDQPTSDAVNTYFVSETARQAGLTVALSGLGGDELFGGYPCTFHDAPMLARSLELASKIPGATTLARTTVGVVANARRWGGVTAALDRPPSLASAYVARRSVFSPAEVDALLADDVRLAGSAFDPVAHVEARTESGGDEFAWLSRAELRSYTHHQLLKDTDVMSMAHSLEVRVPLLDDRLVRLVLAIPESIKRGGSGPKPLLAAAAADLLPARVRERRDKQGFTLPFDRWMKTTMRSWCDETFRDDSTSIFKPDGLRAVWDDYLAGRIHWSRPWAVAALLRWCQEHQSPAS